MRKKFLLILIVFALLFSLMMAGYAEAKPFYDGKTFKIIVGFKPGGGTDFYARLAARYMSKYLPGSKFIVKNIPGAASIIALNRIYASKPDGLTFGAFPITWVYDCTNVLIDSSSSGTFNGTFGGNGVEYSGL